jgi:hypothetical protein
MGYHKAMAGTIQGSISGRGKKLFFLGPSSHVFSGCWGFFPLRGKWPVHEVGHVPPSRSEVKNDRSYTCLNGVLGDI